MNKLCYKVGNVRSNPGEPIRFRLTERIVDRDSEVIEPKGVRLDNYMANPVVLWGHNRDGYKPAIGKILTNSIERTDEYIDADIVFDIVNDPFAAMVEGKVRDGFLSTGSIGFNVITISSEPVLEGQKGATLKEIELYEFSIVNVPANTGAVRKDYEDFFDECEKLGAKIDRNSYFEKYAEYFKPEGGGWDETDNMIRYRVREPKLFVEGSFRSVPIKKDKPRVNSLMGKLKDNPDVMTIQSLSFPKEDDWTLSKAKDWLKDHQSLLKQYTEETEDKIGQAISAANRQIIQNCIDEIGRTIKTMKSLTTTLNELIVAGQQQQNSNDVINVKLDEIAIELKKFINKNPKIETILAKLNKI